MGKNDDVNELTTGFVLFDENGKVLLVYRGLDERFPSKYGVPAGRVKEGESVFDAAVRELNEETFLENDDFYMKGYLNTYVSNNLIMILWWGYLKSNIIIREGKLLDLSEIKEISRANGLAPNVLLAIEDAIKEKTLFEKRYFELDIQDNIKKAKKLLQESFHSIDGKRGWNVYLNLKGVGIIGTSIGILSLANIEEIHQNEKVSQAIQWLKSMQQADGGWSTRSTQKIEAVSITESTALALMALLSINKSDMEIIQKGYTWLLDNQHDDGAWSTNKYSSEKSVYATCKAIQAFIAGKSGDLCLKSIRWLEENQNLDGGWGVAPSSNSSTVHTAHAIITLLKAGKRNDSKIIIKGIEYIKGAYKDNKLWEDIAEVRTIYGPSSDIIRFELKHFAMPWAVIALLNFGESPFAPIILDSISKMKEMQDDTGGWPHSLTPGNYPIWALHDALSMFTEALHFAANFAYESNADAKLYFNNTIRVSDDLGHLYLKALKKIPLAYRLSILVNIFIISFTIMYFYRDKIISFLSIPDIPWVWELFISLVVSAIIPIIYRKIKDSLGRIKFFEKVKNKLLN